MSTRESLADLPTYLRLHAILDSILEIESLLAETDYADMAMQVARAESLAVEMRELVCLLLRKRPVVERIEQQSGPAN
jgi:hypothetical protein